MLLPNHEDAAAEAVTAAPVDRPYLPYLDGLHALAVYLVVAFHAGLDRATGGFIGVDLFFVLSGFLVTQAMLRDLDHHGTIRLWRFYSRRYRRLLPAAFCVLFITAIAYAALATPSAVEAARGGFTASFLYVSNWYFIHQSTSYFAAGAEPSPVLHFWSLSLEEQFYIGWPLVLGGLWWLCGRGGEGPRRHRVSAAIAVGMVASALWALALRHSAPDRAYFGTDTRAYQLLAGALIAVSPSLMARARRYPRALSAVVAVGLVGLIVLGSSVLRLDPIERGVLATALTVALLVALCAGRDGVLRRALSLDPVVYLGRISYGTYLWHWPVVILVGLVADPDPLQLLGISVLAGTALASLSYQLLEHPIRRSAWLDSHRQAVVVTGLAISLVAGLLVVPRILEPGHRSTSVASAAAVGTLELPSGVNLDEVYDEGFGRIPPCPGGHNLDPNPTFDAVSCTLVKGSAPHLLLMGDSAAEMMAAPLAELARQRGFTFSVAIAAGCPWQRDVVHLTGAIRQRCRASKAAWYASIVPDLDPDVVLVMNSDLLPDDEPVYVETPFNAGVRSSTSSSLDALTAGGRKVVILESIPTSRTFSPLDCLRSSRGATPCRFAGNSTPSWLDRLQRKRAQSDPAVSTLDIDALACPYLPVCDPVIDEMVTYWDGAHLTARYAMSLSPAIGKALDDAGVLSP